MGGAASGGGFGGSEVLLRWDAEGLKWSGSWRTKLLLLEQREARPCVEMRDFQVNSVGFFPVFGCFWVRLEAAALPRG